MKAKRVHPHSLFTEFDIHLFREGRHFELYRCLGSHLTEVDGVPGVHFAVWAPNARFVSVIGNFNHWNRNEHALNARWDGSGIWEGFIPDLGAGTLYKYFIISNNNGLELEKADPFARYCEEPPRTASVVWAGNYTWSDKKWLQQREERQALDQPFSVYEVHLASWRRNTLENNRSLTYRELAKELTEYVLEMGYTHVELMPVMEHPYSPSWGYQITGYFAPTSRFGTPDDFKFLVDSLHQAGIGVLLDWVPSHFPGDAHGLFRFDGTALYEHEDARKGYHPDWKSFIFNYGRNEVKAFLISNANFWVSEYHADGLRVDAVASMLYLDYSRNEGEWIPNNYGGRENLEAIALFKEMNAHLYGAYPGIQTIAEESTSWPMVSRPTDMGGLGFGMKWMMGWMNDNLEYFKKDPIYRKFHQHNLTFSLVYAFTENFMLPLSHDEVVHGKGSLLARMPGDNWQKFANLRLLYGWMFVHPGTKLLFMGGEFGQPVEWNHELSLHWHLQGEPLHAGLLELVRSLNKLYRQEKALHQQQFSYEGFEWIDFSDQQNAVISLLRKGRNAADHVLVVLNLTPVVHSGYRIGCPKTSGYREVLNTDWEIFGGSNVTNNGKIAVDEEPKHGRTHSLSLNLPPLAMVVLKPEKQPAKKPTSTAGKTPAKKTVKAPPKR